MANNLIFKNSNDIPFGVSESDFCHWQELIDQREKCDSQYDNDILIVFSDEEPIEEYGFVDLVEYKKYLKDMCNSIDDIEKRERIYKLIENLSIHRASLLAEELINVLHKDYSEICQELENALYYAKHRNLVLGSFSYDLVNNKYIEFVYNNYTKNVITNFRITLYVKNIRKLKGNFKRNIEQTFAHEYFHFYTYTHCSDLMVNSFIYQNRYAQKVVKETLAKNLELSYMKDRYPDFDYDGEISALSKYSVASYPYAGVCYLDSYTKNRYLKFFKRYDDRIFLINLLYRDNEELYYKVLYYEENKKRYESLQNNNFNKPKPKTINTKNYNKYTFNGSNYGKAPLALAVVKYYCEKHPYVTYSELKNVFPDFILKQYGVFEDIKKIKDRDRYYCNKPIKIADSTIVVTTEWTLERINRFISVANNLGMNIKLFSKDIDMDLVVFVISNKKLNVVRTSTVASFNPLNLKNYNNTMSMLTIPKVEPSETFLEMLDRIMEERKLSKYRVYTDCNLDKNQFKKIYDAETSRPSRETIFKLLLGLKLDLKTGIDFLNKAGYSLNNNDILDRIVYYCLENKKYDKVEIDSTLEYFHLKRFFGTDDSDISFETDNE